ncbi:phosphatidylinositol mannoside acyltransferase [Buchananella felis]|uniref:phosphatidylinositol mannoside acyltransferase n=1 Tax=Buchananella felis TaxID=3231492 RepID=UPI0035274CD7
MSAVSTLMRFSPRLPEWVTRAAFAAAGAALGAAHLLGLNAPARRLEANLQRVSPLESTWRRKARTCRSLGHYMRYFGEAMYLPAVPPARFDVRGGINGPAELREKVAQGSIIFALTHTGNWDLAAAWSARNFAPVLTVAERLEPAEDFEAFLRLREQLGMTVLPVSRHEHPFPELVRRSRERNYLVPLLADRDLSAAGVEVNLAGHKALVAPGPAALAQVRGIPIYAAAIRHVRLRGAKRRAARSKWGIVVDVSPPLHTTKKGRAGAADLTQQWVDWFGNWLRHNAEHWHMMQSVFVSDLDPARLARARAKEQS